MAEISVLEPGGGMEKDLLPQGLCTVQSSRRAMFKVLSALVEGHEHVFEPMDVQ